MGGGSAGGSVGGGSAGGSATGFSCDGVTGSRSPLAVCSAARPCTRPLTGPVITSGTQVPVCRTTATDRPAFDDGAPLARAGIDGTARYACLFSPPGASTASPRPLLVWFHGSGGSAQDVYNHTLLRAKAPTWALAPDGGAGFHLLAIQARNLHWPTTTREDGTKHDIYFRDFGTPSTNPDFANADAFIDDLVDAGAVDRARIFTSGWSNGARFAQSYALARHDGGTPGGHHVRATAIFSGTSPFETPDPSLTPSCRLQSPARSSLPMFLLSRSCDILACNAAQADGFRDAGTEVTPGDVMEEWVADLRTRLGNPNVTWQRISGTGVPVNACTPPGLCTPIPALVNHARWPDGLNDNQGNDNEPRLLDALRDAP